MVMTPPLSRRNFLKTLIMASSAAAWDWTGLEKIAAAVPNKNEFPVAVIGAGLGGLVSAAYLAKYGFPVTLVEQHAVAGGYATCFSRGDFTFDVSLHATVADHAMPQAILTDLGIWDKLRIAYCPELRRIITPRFDVTLPSKNPEGVKQALSQVFPHERKGIHAFYSEMQQVIAELWEGKRSGVSVMAQLEPISLEQWMCRHVRDNDVKSCLACFSGYYGLLPRDINALFYAIATGEYLVHGGQYYKTRSQDLSNTIAGCITGHQGKILYHTEADRIVFDKDNRISGIRDTNGCIYPAKAVIANCSTPSLANRLMPETLLPKTFKDEIQKRQMSLSSFVVFLGLKETLDEIHDYEIDFSDHGDSFKNYLFSSTDIAESDISITIYDNLFKGYSLPGKTTLSLMCFSGFEPWEKYETDYFSNNKQAYNMEKERIARRFIERVERSLIPGLSRKIEVMEIGSPLTNMFFTKNPCGAIYGFDRNLPQLGSKTPVKGLFLAGAWSHGGGYTLVMMAGREAAKMVLKDFKDGSL